MIYSESKLGGRLETALIAADPVIGEWSVTENRDEDGNVVSVTLCWSCEQAVVRHVDPRFALSWEDLGGEDIITAAGCQDAEVLGTGADDYEDRYGDMIDTQWVTFAISEDYAC
jgi:hypothetical protein